MIGEKYWRPFRSHLFKAIDQSEGVIFGRGAVKSGQERGGLRD